MTRKMMMSLALAGAAVAVLAGIIWAGRSLISQTTHTTANNERGSTVSPTAGPSPSPSIAASGSAITKSICPTASTTVSTAEELKSALSAAKPGSVIRLSPGTYTGNFVGKQIGSSTAPIWICGSRETILDGGMQRSGYVLHLDGASYWHLLGFAVRNGQKGVVADKASWNVIEGLSVTSIGDEAIHLRAASTNNVVTANTISHTGLFKSKFGEGIYVGSAQKNWCSISDCQPDRSDNNAIVGNVISNTTAENVDIKEGTTGGTISENSLSGVGMVASAASSWINVKGNGWVISGNRGVASIEDGFTTHQILNGWGTNNRFRNNTAAVNGPGFGFHLTPVLGNVIECNNSVTWAQRGLANVPCSPK